METESSNIQGIGQGMGTPQHQQICVTAKPPTPRIQFILQRSLYLRSGCIGTKLEREKQFHQHHSISHTKGIKPKLATSGVIAEFLSESGKGLVRPKSILNTCTAAITCFFDALNCQNPINKEIKAVVNSVVKSATSEPMIKSPVMPQQPFIDLFMSWPENHLLSMEQICLKCLTLMALCLMLRPSDIAPRSVILQNGNSVNVQFSADRIKFLEDGSVEVYLFGVKNDVSRDGFRIFLQPCTVSKVCPVGALQEYLQCNEKVYKDPRRLVLTPLNYPYSSLASSPIAGILNKATKLAGLEGCGFSAKSFRPTGATSAIENGVNPDRVRATGRWKSQQCFEEHYVHARSHPTRCLTSYSYLKITLIQWQLKIF